jgi:hypothetical protein
MRLRISERVDGAEIARNIFLRGCLKQYIWVIAALDSRRKRVCGLGESFGRYDGGRERGRGVEIL